MSSLFLLSSSVHAVRVELQQADLITTEEYRGLSEISDVVRVQSGKSPEVIFQTADVLQRHGLKEASKLLTGDMLYSGASL